MGLIILIKSKIGGGKDTAAKYLVERYGFTQLAFADKIRETVYELNPLIIWSKSQTGSCVVSLRDLVDEFGWETVKRNYPEARRLLQVMGCEVGRKMFGENIWVDMVAEKIENERMKRVVISDFRFENEYYDLPGRPHYSRRIVLLEGRGEGDSHESESLDVTKIEHLDLPTYPINNSGTREALYEDLDLMMLDTLFQVVER